MIGTTLKQRFYIERELGRGGMGAVYRAIDQVLERPVAIKMLKDVTGEDVGRKLRLEAQILARLMHENIVRLYDFDVQDGTYYFIMEEVDGTSFFHRWKQLTIPDRMGILAQIGRALDYAHHQGIIHRDVKPGNILLTKSDQAKLSDFGLSLQTDVTQEVGVARGTPVYMSPEQAKGQRLDHRSDLYSLGVLLYECATGSPPFQGNAMAIMSQHVNAEAPTPLSKNPEISAELDSLIRALMSKNPERRPGSGKEVAEGLEDLSKNNRWLAGNDAVTAEALARAPEGTPPKSGPSGSTSASGGRSKFDADARIAGSAPMDAGGKAGSFARRMIDQVNADPIALDPEQRFLAGHYLAYLLGGSRRRGIFLRRPLDPLNADRARLVLAMTWLASSPGDEESVKLAARLLDERPDVRPLLNPAAVVKYLRSRDTPPKRKRFRQLRQALQQASTHASKHMLDEGGILNPGLMPQKLHDLYKISPERTEVDDQLVERWNRLTDVWRDNADFRMAVLRYATVNAASDPASIELWPEVVYPLIERARWQRRFRSNFEAFWDGFTKQLAPAPGVKMDRMLTRAVPAQVVQVLDQELEEFGDAADAADLFDEAPAATPEEPTLKVRVSAASLHEIAAVQEQAKDFIPLSEPDPIRFTLGELRELWKEALDNLKKGAVKGGHRQVPVGPYRLAVIASIRGHKAGTVAIQGMPNKQIEMLVPSFAGGSASRPIVAVWPYPNRSLAITYFDIRGVQRYILWDATNSQQSNFDDAADLNHALFQRSMETPDQLDRVLTNKFRPINPV